MRGLRNVVVLGAMFYAFVATGQVEQRGPSFTPSQLAERTVQRRGVEATVWGMPIVSFDAMRQAFFRDAGATYGDIVYLSKPADWRTQITTPNAASLYVYFNYNVKDGPWVLEFPAAVGAGLFGTLNDAWQAPIVEVGPRGEDQGKGGKYLIMPPGYESEVPAGYLPVRSSTFNGYALFRAIPETQSQEDTAKAIGLVKQLKLYPLSEAGAARKQKHIDMAGKAFDGIAKMDGTFFDMLARMVNEEPVQERDLAVMGQLRAIGIEKGKEFTPDGPMRATLGRAAAEAQAGFMEGTKKFDPYWPGSHWGINPLMLSGSKTGFTFQTDSMLDVDGRGLTFFLACAVPKELGKATFYLVATSDAAGDPLEGDRSYRLRVPANVPAKQFWAVTVYDPETAGFFRESPKVEVNSYQEVQKNADGSVDVFFGARAPAGKESNWVHTPAGKRWFTFFRFYGPEPAVFDKSWKLPDIESVK